jgi:UDP-N-acetylmuramoylalanine--D-glutamate ligase
MKRKKVYLVLGIGKTGLSCIDYLFNKNETIIIADTRDNPSNLEYVKNKYPDIDIELGDISDELITKADIVIVSPGISFSESFIKKAAELKKEIIGDVDLFLREARAPIIAVTGTNGKTTVTTLIGKMAKRCGLNVAVGGNIGTPVLELLKEQKPDLYVLELSSFQLQTTHSMSFDVAALLNISEDHIDHHGSMESYIDAKMKIFDNCKNAVINKNVKSKIKLDSVSVFSLDKPFFENEFGIVANESKKFLANNSELIMPISDLMIEGTHNQENALAALAAGQAFGFNVEKMIEALKEFKGIEHRCQLVAEKNDVKWYNDSKATNVGATIAAVEGLGSSKKNIILILGGVGKDADFSPLAQSIEKHVKKVILFGRDSEIISKAIKGNTKYEFAEDLNDVVNKANTSSKAGDIVLFAPACASFDMFKNYEFRGKEFVKTVNYHFSNGG